MLLLILGLLSLLTGGAVCLIFGGFQTLTWLWLLPLGTLGGLLLWLILGFLLLWFLCAIVRLDRPQENDSPFYRRMIHLLVDAVVTVGRVHIHAEGLDKVPAEGRFLLVSNHTHDTDPVVLLHCMPKSQLAFISKRENDKKFLIGKLQHKILCQPINRENDKEALRTILNCVKLIKEDKVSIGVFPEGYIHQDRKLHHFRHGVLKIAQKAHVPIVICTLRNTKEIFHNLLHLKPTEVYLNVLEVIPAEEVAGRTTVALGEHIFNQMARDLGPENVADELYEETT